MPLESLLLVEDQAPQAPVESWDLVRVPCDFVNRSPSLPLSALAKFTASSKQKTWSIVRMLPPVSSLELA